MPETEPFSPTIFNKIYERLNDKNEILYELGGEKAVETDMLAIYGKKKSERIARSETILTPEQQLFLEAKIDGVRTTIFTKGKHGKELVPYSDYIVSRTPEELEDYYEYEPADQEGVHFMTVGADKKPLTHEVGNKEFLGYQLDIAASIDERIELDFNFGFNKTFALSISYFTKELGVANYMIWKRPLAEMTLEEFEATNFLLDAYLSAK